MSPLSAHYRSNAQKAGKTNVDLLKEHKPKKIRKKTMFPAMKRFMGK